MTAGVGGIRFEVPGPPRPKQRARRGTGGRWYTPAQTRDYERHVAMCAYLALRDQGLLWGDAFWRRDWKYALAIRIVPSRACPRTASPDSRVSNRADEQ